MTLDSILNAIIPPAIFIGLGVWIYSKAKNPIDKFFGKIKEKISGEGKNETYEGSYNIDYQPVGTYDYNDNI